MPGGATSNYFTYLARGDVALSITLTASSGSLAAITVPLVFNGASTLLLDRKVDVSLPFWQTMRSILLALTFLKDPRYTAVPVAYLILMFVFVPGYVALARRAAIRHSG